MIKVYSISL